MQPIQTIRNARFRPDPDSSPQWIELTIADDTIRSAQPQASGTDATGEIQTSNGEIDAQGAFIIPGLINLHTHLFRKVRPGDPPARITDPVAMTVRALRNGYDYLARGVTTVRDLGAPLDLDIAMSEMEQRGDIVSPRIVPCGRPLTETGGHNHDFGVVVDGTENLRQAVRERILSGVGYIKLMASLGGTRYFKEHHTELPPTDPAEALQMVEDIIARANPARCYRKTERDGYTVEELTAASDEARRQGWRTCAHAVTAQSLINCVEAGLHTVEHGTFMDHDAARRIADSNTIYVPTISTAFNRVVFGKTEGWPDYLLRWAVFVSEPWFAAVQVAHDAGVQVAVGTDGGGEMVMEMQLIHRAGYSRHDVLRGATSRAARALGRTDIGRIAPEAKADLVLLPGDPLEDLEVLANPLATIKGGCLFESDTHTL